MKLITMCTTGAEGECFHQVTARFHYMFNYLSAAATLCSFSRPGALIQLTMQEFEEAVPYDIDPGGLAQDGRRAGCHHECQQSRLQGYGAPSQEL